MANEKTIKTVCPCGRTGYGMSLQVKNGKVAKLIGDKTHGQK